MVYALGRPIATTRDRDGFFAHLKGGRSVLTVALPSEIEVMRSHFGLVVTAGRSGRRLRSDQGEAQTSARRGATKGTSRRRRRRLDAERAPGWTEARADARKVSGAAGSWFRGETGRRTAYVPRGPLRPACPGSAARSRIARRRPGRSRGFEQDARLREHDLPGTVDVVADHGAAHQERLGQHSRQALAQAGVDHGVDGIRAARGCGPEAPAR